MQLGRIIEVANDQRHLSTWRGFMLVKDTSNGWQEVGRIPLDDVGAVIANAHGLSYTNNLLVSLSERAAPFVLCGANHNAVGMLLPVEGNYQQAKRFDAQIGAGTPLVKRLWAEIVRSKLRNQAQLLDLVGKPSAPLKLMASKVKSGDTQNLEAQGAQYYWSVLLGNGFRRDRTASGVNAMLNYGYTVLRSATARAVVAAGLHPTIGLHHKNESNAMRLVDDLMEPYRPIIDAKVWALSSCGEQEVTPATKRALVELLFMDVPTAMGATPIYILLQRTATSLAQVFLGERLRLDLPGSLPDVVRQAEED